ncbi:hypothetical protein SAMN04487911_11448 [Arenibacter nanhaiticus]|uniref:Uncharacterized protein n=1 Tax=Arenibacter nanhaiticus TaxID=558155 RepID=A0A1M6HK33_9FLAO|nr:hypothetical protein SAMN04487911_11448 [Arenibacter nanhaiticus]
MMDKLGLVVYPKVWGELKPPDWSISKKSFHRFVELLAND